MNKKRERLLNEMIAIYIKDGEPIGSESLKLSVDMKISSATIRNYFKVLVDEGILAQPHISSGKIPTNNTLKSYWRARINIANVINIDSMDSVNKASEEYKIFCNIKIFKQETLQKLINYENKYSILVFDTTETIVPYTKHLHNFLNELLYQDIEEIKNIAKSVCANSLYTKLENISSSKVYNFGFDELNFIKDLGFILNLIKGKIYYELKNGFYFDLLGEGYLGILQDIRFKDNYGKMFVAGELRRDYSSFYNAIAS
ncbi:hypothetical protein CCY99_05990 [Helicobacter sp. 16-1353]|uniref:heat-shock protein n=1 Tax=Helicobacter sp. 16-1353 TaxID=2004996 RepID=UPI000DCEE7C7|nr:heat-shock protein [Helicobacter sp. 16-1353]RAX53140.1 hypothetical protein CCY99_05990 [Helicobacter sp. 16-1353]